MKLLQQRIKVPVPYLFSLLSSYWTLRVVFNGTFYGTVKSAFSRVFVLTWLLLVASCASHKTIAPNKPRLAQGNYSAAYEFLDRYIQYEMAKHNITGLSVALVVKDSPSTLRWAKGYGLADSEKGRSVSTDTLFRAGSLAKFVNTLAILQLYEQGKVDLDAPIQHYIPEFYVRSRFGDHNITIKQLLTHQSGLPSDWIAGMWRSKPENFKHVLRYLNSVYVSQPPDTVFQYSNVAHDVIGVLIERVSGETYQSYIKNEIFSPLAMQGSAMSASPKYPQTATSYNNRGHAVKAFATRDVPAAGLTTNASDYTRLLDMVLSQGLVLKEDTATRFLEKDSLKLLYNEYTAEHPLNFGKHLGLSLYVYDDVFARAYPVYGHDGATPGQRALFKFSPKLGAGIVLLSNNKHVNHSLHRIANQALQILYEAKTGKIAPYPHVNIAHASDKDLTQISDFAGYYATRLGLVHISSKNDAVFAKAFGKRFRLNTQYDSELRFLNYKLLGIFPINLGYYGSLGLSLRYIDNKKYLIGTNNLQQRLLLGTEINSVPIPEAWQNRIGKYELVQALEVMDLPSGGLKIVDGFLVAYAKTEEGQKLQFVLTPINDREAIVAGVGRGLGETVFVEEQEVQGERLELLKFADMYFRKVR